MKEEDNALVSFANKLTTPSSPTVRIFETSDSGYACLNADAAVFAQNVYGSASAVRRVGSKNTEMCTANTTLMHGFLRQCLEALATRVEIYSLNPGSRSSWQSKPVIASPGDWSNVRERCGEATQRPVMASVKVEKSGNKPKVAIFYCDFDGSELGFVEFTDNELYNNLESCLIQLGVKELLLGDHADKRIFEVVKGLDILPTQPNKSALESASNSDYPVQALNTICKDIDENLLNLITGSDLCKEALTVLTSHLSLLDRVSDSSKLVLKQHDIQAYMRLDSAALRAMNVLPSPQELTKTASLYGLLNQCRTVAGSRTLFQWLKQPLTDAISINKRLELVAEFVDNSLLRLRLQDELLPCVPDLLRVSNRFGKGKARLEDVVNIYSLAIRLPEFLAELQNEENIDNNENSLKAEIYTEISSANDNLVKFIELVEETIDLNALERHEYTVNTGLDDNLSRLHEQRVGALNDMQVELDMIKEKLSCDRVKLENNPTLGYCFRLTRTDASALRNQTGIIDLKTQKSGQFFTTPTLRSLATQYVEYGEEQKRAQHQVEREVINVASTYLPILAPLGAVLADLDVLLAFSQVAGFSQRPYTRPVFSDSLILAQSRHPCVEVQPEMQFIANDVSLVREDSRFAVITGPNMGGKSTYIRQIGAIALLAQIGSFVPCDSAELPVLDCVLARVGAGDSQLRGISTFMAEMLETASILRHAGPRSLIIIDELGRGTSTYDGYGIAHAVSEHIITRLGSWCLFATHFHELTALAEMHKGVVNLHVAASTQKQSADSSQSSSDSPDLSDVTLLYTVEKGICTESFGVHVAEAVHFPAKVVSMAKRKALELEAGAVDEAEYKKVEENVKKWLQVVEKGDSTAEKVAKLRKIVNSE